MRTLENEWAEAEIYKSFMESKIFGTPTPSPETEVFNGLIEKRKNIKLNQRKTLQDTSDFDGPFKPIKFQLEEHEIMEDLIAINKC